MRAFAPGQRRSNRIFFGLQMLAAETFHDLPEVQHVYRILVQFLPGMCHATQSKERMMLVKTPEGIKKEMDHSRIETSRAAAAFTNAIAYILELEEQIQLMKIQMHGDCGVCKHRSEQEAVFRKAAKKGEFAFTQRCEDCIKNGKSAWEYEGLPEVKRNA